MIAPRLAHPAYVKALRLFAPARATRTWLALASVLLTERQTSRAPAPIPADSAPAWWAVAPQAAILGAERVVCRGCGCSIYATGTRNVTRRADGWRCGRCEK